jgi:hypothetical protein
MRVGIFLTIMLAIALSQVGSVQDVKLPMIIIFGFAVAIGAANWKPGAIILAAVVLFVTGTHDVKALALNLAPVGFGLVLGASMKGQPNDGTVEPVRAIPVGGERRDDPRSHHRPTRTDPHREYEHAPSDGPVRRPARDHDAGRRADERWMDGEPR